MKLKLIFSIMLIASLILISVDTAVAQYGNSDKECQGTCDQLRDRICQDPVVNCEEDCIPIGDENKHMYRRNC